MIGNTVESRSATILQFPGNPRIAANRFAEQARRSVELAAERSVRVAPASGWYHDAAAEEQERRP